MLSPCCLCVSISPPFLKARIVQPEEMAVTVSYKHMYNVITTPESQYSAVREEPWRRPLLGSRSVIRVLLLLAYLHSVIVCLYVYLPHRC
jgi:hypothetical protein